MPSLMSWYLAGLQLVDPPVSASRMLGLKVCAIKPTEQVLVSPPYIYSGQKKFPQTFLGRVKPS